MGRGQMTALTSLTLSNTEKGIGIADMRIRNGQIFQSSNRCNFSVALIQRRGRRPSLATRL